jgi:hypothetical protein
VASLELRNKKSRVVFMHAGRKYSYALDTADRATAEGLRGVERALMLIEQKVIRVPDGADVVKNGGKPEEEKAKPAPAPLTLRRLNEKYLQTHGQGRWRPTAWRPSPCT